jgi:hypothetical protein
LLLREFTFYFRLFIIKIALVWGIDKKESIERPLELWRLRVRVKNASASHSGIAIFFNS